MNRVHIIGGKNHGKTTLVTELVAELLSRGLRVGTIKHTHHHHELDTPGKDSHRHREAGSEVVGILSRTMNAVFWSNDTPETAEESAVDSDFRYQSFEPAFADCDIVVVEGDTHTTALKLEVWRAVNETRPISDRLEDVCALITDDPVVSSLPHLARADIPATADFIVKKLDLHS